MLFLAHQLGHTISEEAAAPAAAHYSSGTFMLMGTGISILLAVLLR